MSIKERIEKLVGEFENINDWEDRYKHIIKIGKEEPLLTEEVRKEEDLVKGCQSSVWLQAHEENGKIIFHADSDAAITRGIVGMLVRVYSGSTPDEILTTKPDFLDKIGIREHLSMNRSNGLLAMLKQINIYAIAFKAKLAQ